ncbi:MAG: TatD family deoxyribonuclease [Gimesia sp.]|uniref:Qat anti-phage system TatD family nuclease QatD n=1 Tax=Gimesia sp. TaxID=2024833 RepID=UPI000C4C45B2|nr:Qat anti-phage system TatD family nuclease QatD [Gimesia sp.]MAX38387.1 TatD family deoxyribonuclease [Gimesia sp.]|tara:strand:+ start:33249 stop:34004 length:756 start_codon:yes stop_codon:yes gene_type:complete
MLIDTHCHIDHFPDPMALAFECESAGITTIAVTNIPSHYQVAVEHIGSMRFIRPALGFHPLAVAENIDELPLFLSLLEHVEFVGEIGLDYSRKGIGSKKVQLQAFREIAKALSQSARYVTLHSRKSAKDVLEVLEEFGVTNAVFHWYSDSISTLRRAIDAGHYFSVNTAMLNSKSGQIVVETVPRDRILTETDGPYIKIGRAAARPSDVAKVISGIADLWGEKTDEVEAQITENYNTLCTSVGVRNGVENS